MMKDVEQLKKFIEEEVYLQFSQHFRKLTESKAKSDQKKESMWTPKRQSNKTSVVAMRLYELETKM